MYIYECVCIWIYVCAYMCCIYVCMYVSIYIPQFTLIIHHTKNSMHSDQWSVLLFRFVSEEHPDRMLQSAQRRDSLREVRRQSWGRVQTGQVALQLEVTVTSCVLLLIGWLQESLPGDRNVGGEHLLHSAVKSYNTPTIFLQ